MKKAVVLHAHSAHGWGHTQVEKHTIKIIVLKKSALDKGITKKVKQMIGSLEAEMLGKPRENCGGKNMFSN